jgi:predicted DNA-binding protein
MLRCMSATRTQIYLTREQRRVLDERAAREGRTLADLVREAVDAYIAHGDAATVNEAAAATFGALPDMEPVDRREWDRSGRWPDW